MAQYKNWENEYKNPKFVTKSLEPQKFIHRFFKFLKKEQGVRFEGLKVLDLGCGTGRNSIYFAQQKAEVTGLEISETALKIAQEQTKKLNLEVKYFQKNIGEEYPFDDEYFDLILDVTSSNALNEKERDIYLKETNRVLKKGGYFFVRILCKDGDKNAKKLLKMFPGKESDTYVMPGTSLVERVFSQNDFVDLYSKYFNVLKTIKEDGYTNFAGQNYKRNFLIAYLQKK